MRLSRASFCRDHISNAEVRPLVCHSAHQLPVSDVYVFLVIVREYPYVTTPVLCRRTGSAEEEGYGRRSCATSSLTAPCQHRTLFCLETCTESHCMDAIWRQLLLRSSLGLTRDADAESMTERIVILNSVPRDKLMSLVGSARLVLLLPGNDTLCCACVGAASQWASRLISNYILRHCLPRA